MKKLSTSVLFSFALLLGLFGGFTDKVEAQYTVPDCDKATINGIVYPNGNSIVYWVEWWVKGNPSVKTAGTKMTSASNDPNGVGFTYTMPKLSPTTTYEYWTVSMMTKNGSTKWSNILAFSTPSCPLPTVNMKINGQDTVFVQKGGSVTLTWTSTPSAGNSCTLYYEGNNPNGTPVNPSSTGYQVGPINKDTTFRVTCYNGTGSGSGSVTAKVNQPIVNPTVNISLDNPNLSYKGSTIIRWTSANATSCTASGNWSGNKPTSGSENTGNLTSTKTYNITCSGQSGTVSANDSVTVNVSAYNPPANPTLNFYASNNQVASGGSFDLKWSTKNATSCNSSSSQNDWNGGRKVDNNNTVVYTINNFTRNTTYTMTCNGGAGTTDVTKSVSVNLQSQQNPTATLTASPSTVTKGTNNNYTYLTWNSNNANTCSASWANSNATSGSTLVYPTTTPSQTYSITCTGNGGSITANTTVTVNNVSTQAPNVTFTASDSNINQGESSTLSWSSNANSCSNSWNSDNGASGSTTVYPTATRTYTVTCTNEGGSTTRTVTVNVNSNQNNNDDVTVNTNSATSIGNTYATLNGYVDANDNGDAIAWFKYGTSSNSYGYSSSQINRGQTSGSNYSYYADNLSPNTTYYFRAFARNDSGAERQGSEYSFTTTGGGNGCTSNCNNNAYVTTQTANTSTGGTTATLNGYLNTDGNYFSVKWFEYGLGYNTNIKKDDIGHYSYSSGNFSDTLTGLTPNTLYSFRAAAKNSNGSVLYGNQIQFTTPSTGTTSTNNPCANGSCAAVTTFATSIGSTSARLNGLGLANTSLDNTGQFEWGTVESDVANGQGIKTGLQDNIGSDLRNSFSESLFSLGSSKTYYYRAVMKNSYGTFYGDVVSFRTNASSTNTNTNTNTTTNTTNNVTNNTNNGTSRPSLIALSVSRDGETIRRGDTLEYIINYRNVSSTRSLKNVILQVAVPKDLEFVEASRGFFSEDDKVLVANIGNLAPQEEGTVRMRVKVSGDADLNKTIVVSANMAYTIVDNNTQEEVFAYSTNMISDTSSGSQFGALAVLGGDGFLPGTLLGWLILILLITLLVLAVRKAYKGPANSRVDASNIHDLPH